MLQPHFILERCGLFGCYCIGQDDYGAAHIDLNMWLMRFICARSRGEKRFTQRGYEPRGRGEFGAGKKKKTKAFAIRESS